MFVYIQQHGFYEVNIGKHSYQCKLQSSMGSNPYRVLIFISTVYLVIIHLEVLSVLLSAQDLGPLRRVDDSR